MTNQGRSSGRFKVFYDQRQSVTQHHSLSPSASKPALVVQGWKDRGVDFELASVAPLVREDFYLVHDKAHVDAVLDLKSENGFGTRSHEVAQSLYWTSGSLVTACAHAIRSGENTCSPTSGFHHANWNHVSGYCTFNGLMVAAVKSRGLLPGKKIGIIDIDYHYGDGTAGIIKHAGLDYVQHYTFGGELYSGGWGGGPLGDEWLKRLPGIVESFGDCGLVIYQAGADPHMNDPLGGALSDEQLRERDRIVFTTLKRLGIPCAWNLAGGYQKPIQKVLNIHNATIEECLKVRS